MGILSEFDIRQKCLMKISKMSRMLAIAIVLILALCQHSDGTAAKFTDKLKDMLQQPSRHLEESSTSHVLKKRQTSSDSGDYYDAPGNNPSPDYMGRYAYSPANDFDDCSKYGIEEIYKNSYMGPVCDIIEVRNTADALKDLENCTIVNGFVHLLFMHNLTEADLMKYRFPKLRVITEYLLIYRVYHLKTLRYMFPNLAVIGGLTLFGDYSLVLYENIDMTEIGLENLRYINKGNVRIEKNHMLCYISTIDWRRLGSYSNKEIGVFAKQNRNEQECVNGCGENSHCGDAETPDRQFCWGLNACQKKSCSKECPDACDANLQCTCHEQCLAGCTAPNDNSKCIACKDKYFNNTCLSECPPGKYLIHKWLCIEAEECQKLDWHFYKGECRYNCPPNYQVNITDCMRICTKCNGDCGEDCHGDFEITTANSVKAIEGCRSITGALTININGGSDVVEKLESGLSELESIGALIVRQSFPLVTMSFLRNLKRITGKNMQVEVYSMYFLENHNLEELWNMTESNLVIERGKAFFHFNAKLCLSEIAKVQRLTPDHEDATDISNVTNGDRATCDMVPIILLDVEVYVKPYAIVKWENYKLKDDRTLIGYQVYYKESPERNAKQYDGVDACRLNSWTVVETLKSKTIQSFTMGENGTLQLNESEPKTSSLLLSGLKAYTQYAYYVRATTTSRSGAMSAIAYFKTKPATPSKPRNLKVVKANSSSMNITWELPLSPNGVMSHYIVEWQRQPERDIPNVREVDTCKRGASPVNKIHPEQAMTTSKPAVEILELDLCPKCDCKEKEDMKKEIEIAKESTLFENFLQDKLFPSDNGFYSDYSQYGFEEYSYDYVAENTTRKRRSLYEDPERPGNYSFRNRSSDANLSTKSPIDESTTQGNFMPDNPKMRMVVFTNWAILNNLSHFSEYSIQVYACNNDSNPQSKTNLSFPIKEKSRKRYQGGPMYTSCSIEALIMKRTSHDKSKDKIPPQSIKKEVQVVPDKVVLSWDMPPDPNAYIKNFDINIESEQNGRNETKCVRVNSTADKLGHVSYTLTAPNDLSSGSYRVSILPVSLAGEGIWSHPISIDVMDPITQQNHNRISIIIGVLLGLVVTVIIISAVLYVKYRHKDANQQGPYTDINPDYMPYVYIPDDYEIELEKVEVLEEIGQGNFGKVFSGIAQNIVKGQSETKVAIKKLREKAMPRMRYDFLKEASLMKAFNAHHVVRLLGVVSKTTDPMVIMEFMENGDLKSYLRKRREDPEDPSPDFKPPILQEKLQMAAEIADGMAYLAAYKFVHRDLAARNCLVNAQGTVKIGDFGLARDIYETDYYRKESRGFLPIRWMAPESLKDGVFDWSSDVWSYGIVLWELATLAEQPYRGKTHDEVTRFVIDGGYMERPKNCPKKLYDLMTVCWQFNPKMRPVFMEIVNSLYIDVNDAFKEVCYFGKSDDILPNDELGYPGQNHSDGTEASYPYTDIRTSTSVSRIENNGIHPSRTSDYVYNKNSKKQPSPNTASLSNSVETQCLLPPEREDRSHGDTRSLNTTSTSAPRTPSFGNKNLNPNRYSSESSYENESDNDGYVSPRDSGTFVNPVGRARPGDEGELLVRYKARVNQDQRKSGDIECDLESGLDEGMWGNSTSHSSASTPTEIRELLPLGRQNDGHMIMHTASSNC